MFNVARNKGFQLQFTNGYTVSVQFGPGNYCDVRGTDFSAPEKTSRWSSQTAEVAAFLTDRVKGSHIDYISIDGFTSNDVTGWLSTDEVAEFISKVAAIPKEKEVRGFYALVRRIGKIWKGFVSFIS